MSLINKVLQDLDERHALAPDGKLPPQQVRPVAPARKGREWFWRIVAALMLGAVGWVGWVAYQLVPRPAVATSLAFEAAKQAREKPAPQALASATPPLPTAPDAAKPADMGDVKAAAPVVKAPPAEVRAAAGKPQARAPASPPDLFKLALSIETPLRSREAPPAQPPKPVPQDKAPAANAAPRPKLEKRDQPATPSERAEAEFRRADAFLRQGRLSETEGALTAALVFDPGHEPARQALVSLYLEQRRIDEAGRLLEDGLARNPTNARFAMVLSRIRAGRGDYASAADLLARVHPSAADESDFHALRGAVLQKLGRHEEASQAYQAAVAGQPENGISWVGLGISLEALQRRPEAAEAFRRAVATGTLTAEVKNYAEQRARALR